MLEVSSGSLRDPMWSRGRFTSLLSRMIGGYVKQKSRGFTFRRCLKNLFFTEVLVEPADR